MEDFLAWLSTEWEQFKDLGGDTFRNVSLFVAAVFGFGLAFWRSKVASKHNKIAESGLNIDRFQKGAAMLGDERLSVRQAGILMLSELAQQNMHEYFDQTQKVICSYIRERSKEQLLETESKYITSRNFDIDISPECHTALNELSTMNRKYIRKNPNKLVRYDLTNCNLQNCSVKGLNLSNANLFNSCFRNSVIIAGSLKNARLNNSNVSGSVIFYTNLKDANLNRVDFDDAIIGVLPEVFPEYMKIKNLKENGQQPNIAPELEEFINFNESHDYLLPQNLSINQLHSQRNINQFVIDKLCEKEGIDPPININKNVKKDENKSNPKKLRLIFDFDEIYQLVQQTIIEKEHT